MSNGKTFTGDKRAADEEYDDEGVIMHLKNKDSFCKADDYQIQDEMMDEKEDKESEES